MQRVFDRLLRLYEFDPRPATTVSEAMSVTERESIDAFILDLRLGRGQSGIEMLGWLRQQPEYIATPVFVVTGNLDIPEEEQTLIRHYRAHVFYKGQSLELLIDDLRRVLVEEDPGQLHPRIFLR